MHKTNKVASKIASIGIVVRMIPIATSNEPSQVVQTASSSVITSVTTRVTKVSKDYFPVEKSIDIQWTCSALGHEALGKQQQELEQLRQRLVQLRADAMSWGTQQVKGIITENAQSRGIACLSFKGLTALWKKDSSPEFAAKLWYSCYGDFEDAPKWEENLEEEYMKHIQYEYMDDPTDCEGDKRARKGCFARLFSHCKNHIIKGLNRATSGPKGHGGSIRLKMTKEEAKAAKNDPKMKNKKRKKGTTKGNFYNLASKENANPAVVLRRMEDNKVVAPQVCTFQTFLAFVGHLCYALLMI